MADALFEASLRTFLIISVCVFVLFVLLSLCYACKSKNRRTVIVHPGMGPLGPANNQSYFYYQPRVNGDGVVPPPVVTLSSDYHYHYYNNNGQPVLPPTHAFGENAGCILIEGPASLQSQYAYMDWYNRQGNVPPIPYGYGQLNMQAPPMAAMPPPLYEDLSHEPTAPQPVPEDQLAQEISRQLQEQFQHQQQQQPQLREQQNEQLAQPPLQAMDATVRPRQL